MAKVRPYQAGDEVAIACDRGWRPGAGTRYATLLFKSEQQGRGCWQVLYADGRQDVAHERRFTLETPASDERAA